MIEAMLKVLAIVTVLAGTGLAQPAPQQPPAPVPYWRFTLTDGRVIDAYVVGGDPQSYFVQTPQGTFSIAKALVTSTVALVVPPPIVMPPQAQPVPMMMMPPTPMATEDPLNQTLAGIVCFGSFYGMTAIIAASRDDDDPDAKAGYIPVIGPLIWTASDAGDWGEDGYDWLALGSAVFQAGGIAGMIKGLAGDHDAAKTASTSSTLTLQPVSTPTYAGFSLGGVF